MDYEKRGADFAGKWGVGLKVLGKRYAKYFDEDAECRWVFKLRLSRGRKSYTFEFGQSIFNGDAEAEAFCKALIEAFEEVYDMDLTIHENVLM